MVKVIFQLGEKFYWIDHVEMFEVSSQTEIVKPNLKEIFYKYPGTFWFTQWAEKKVSKAYQ